jgi:hypothetical protein
METERKNREDNSETCLDIKMKTFVEHWKKP